MRHRQNVSDWQTRNGMERLRPMLLDIERRDHGGYPVRTIGDTALERHGERAQASGD
jgi:hypothetical protein